MRVDARGPCQGLDPHSEKRRRSRVVVRARTISQHRPVVSSARPCMSACRDKGEIVSHYLPPSARHHQTIPPNHQPDETFLTQAAPRARAATIILLVFVRSSRTRSTSRRSRNGWRAAAPTTPAAPGAAAAAGCLSSARRSSSSRRTRASSGTARTRPSRAPTRSRTRSTLAGPSCCRGCAR